MSRGRTAWRRRQGDRGPLLRERLRDDGGAHRGRGSAQGRAHHVVLHVAQALRLEQRGQAVLGLGSIGGVECLWAMYMVLWPRKIYIYIGHTIIMKY